MSPHWSIEASFPGVAPGTDRSFWRGRLSWPPGTLRLRWLRGVASDLRLPSPQYPYEPYVGMDTVVPVPVTLQVVRNAVPVSLISRTSESDAEAEEVSLRSG